MVSDVISFNKSINRRRFVELTLTQYTLQYTFYSLQALNVQINSVWRLEPSIGIF